MALLLPLATVAAGAGYATRRWLHAKDEESTDGVRSESQDLSSAPAESSTAPCEEIDDSASLLLGEDAAVGPMPRDDEAELAPDAPPAATHDADERDSTARQMIRDAVAVYRSRAYTGSITISHKVGIFTETCSLSVRNDVAAALPEDGAANGALPADNPKLGRALAALLARLERRAVSWDSMDSGCMQGLDPLLSTSASFGFAVPLIKVGWGFTISLSITKTSLLRWARRRDGGDVVAKAIASPSASDDTSSALAASADALLLADE
mmetsp:Transcript_19774/g.45435  ORF Transcript_19774/g.45435 Transcript_19774/m.45435 type:complete len:267 (-) Transcript_19774:209-1009(-)